MIARLCSVLLLSFTVFGAFIQNDYVLDFYRIEVPFSDPKYIENVKAVTYKFNRTQPAFNLSFDFVMDYSNELEVIATADKFVSNEYRDFPIHFQFNFCQGLKENHFGMADFYKCGNFPECPMVKGSYKVVNWYPDASKFPPFIPNGKYRLTLEFVWKETKVLVAVGYAEILRPLNMKRKKF